MAGSCEYQEEGEGFAQGEPIALDLESSRRLWEDGG